jgi:hypothetical protein
VTTSSYYAEMLVTQEGSKGRYVVFLDPQTVEAWNNGAKELPLSKTFVAKGPNRETVVLEQVKDAATNEAITRRLVTTFNAKHRTKLPLP